MTKRYTVIDFDELYCIIDTKDLRTLEDFEQEAKANYNEDDFTPEEIALFAHDHYCDYLYERTLSGEEIINRLNTYEHDIRVLREAGQESQVKIETLSKIILRQSEQLKQLQREWK